MMLRRPITPGPAGAQQGLRTQMYNNAQGPPGLQGVPPGMAPGMAQGMPPGMAPGMAQGMPPGALGALRGMRPGNLPPGAPGALQMMPRGMPPGMPQGRPGLQMGGGGYGALGPVRGRGRSF